jgi:hypothetical protein|tara:strand:- start:53 stop:337 length:285 start_codon:yes stop_codon:yes gene_type:complete
MNHNAMYNSHPSVASIRGNECFDIDGNPVAVDQSAYEAEVARLQAEYDSQEYARLRASAYAPIGDQLDMQYWDEVNGTTTWTDHVAEIKARFPK